MPVDVVGLDVEEDGDARPKLVDVLELEAGQLADHPVVRREESVERGERPADVPRDDTPRPAARRIAPSSSLVVVFPFVPVTPIIGRSRAR